MLSIVALITLVTAACADTTGSTTNTTRPQPTRTPTSTARAEPTQTRSACVDHLFREAAEAAGLDCPHLPPLTTTGVVVKNPPGRRGRVREIIDGATLRVTFGSVDARVRLFLIGASEMSSPECYHREVRVYIEILIPVGTIVWLEESETARDQSGQPLYYVWFEQGSDRYRMLQDAIVRDGYQEVAIHPLDRRYEEWLRQGQADAERLGRGLWSICVGFGVPLSQPTPTPVTTAVPTNSQPPDPTSNTGNCDPSYPSVCIPPVSQVGDLDCADIPHKQFTVLRPDPHNFDRDGDGIGCEN